MQLLRRAASEPRDRHCCGGGGYAPRRRGGSAEAASPSPALPGPAQEAGAGGLPRTGRTATAACRRLCSRRRPVRERSRAERRAAPGGSRRPRPAGQREGRWRGAAPPDRACPTGRTRPAPLSGVDGGTCCTPRARPTGWLVPVWRRRGQKRGHSRPPRGDGAPPSDGSLGGRPRYPHPRVQGAARPGSSLGACAWLQARFGSPVCTHRQRN